MLPLPATVVMTVCDRAGEALRYSHMAERKTGKMFLVIVLPS
jgi:hypothetical protein